jgi:hypothetical protein
MHWIDFDSSPATRAFVLLAALSVPLGASSQSPRASWGGIDSPSSGRTLPAEEIQFQFGQEPAMKANHPPIEEIPPAPMSERDNERGGDGGPGSALHYDATTRTLKTMPVRSSTSSAEPRFGGQSFDGVPGHESPSSESEVTPQGFGTMSQVSQASLSQHPWRRNVKLVMRFISEAGNTLFFVCSGTMQDAGIVFTAGHCIYQHSPTVNGTAVPINDWAEEVWVYPAWDGEGGQFSAPGNAEHRDHWGWARGTSYMAFTGWTDDQNYDWDIGAIRLWRTQTRQVGMLTGWFAWSHSGSCDWVTGQTFHNASYPTENCPTAGLHTGREMYYWFGSFDSCPSDNRVQIDTTAGCLTALWGGQSGSGAYYIENDSRYTHAFASTSDRSSLGRYARLWEAFITEFRDNMRPGVRGDVADYELLRFRSDPPLAVVDGNSVGPSRVNVTNPTNDDPAARSFTLRVYLSTNNIVSAADTLLATWTYNNVDFSAMQVRQFNVPAPVIPPGTTPGTYWLGAVLDSGSDGNFSNNNVWGWDAQEIQVVTADVFHDRFEN